MIIIINITTFIYSPRFTPFRAYVYIHIYADLASASESKQKYIYTNLVSLNL